MFVLCAYIYDFPHMIYYIKLKNIKRKKVIDMKEVKGRKILHLLCWRWKDIESHLEKIKEYGFNTIQTSPLFKCKPLYDANGRIQEGTIEWWNIVHKEWWKLYQPISFDTIGNFLGTEEDFISLCKKGEQLGIDICPDIVVRHVANADDNELKPHPLVDEKLLKYIKLHQRNADNYKERWQQTHLSTQLPMFEYENTEFQREIVIPILQKIMTYAHGFRGDQFCKHYLLPSEGGTFLTNVMNSLPKDKFYYGEGIEVESKYLEEYSQYMYPIVSFHEWWGSKKAVRFAESHDTTESFMYTKHWTPQKRLEGYEQCLKMYGNAMWYARRMDDNIIFSEEMKCINHTY